jgi:hypothetical protein
MIRPIDGGRFGAIVAAAAFPVVARMLIFRSPNCLIGTSSNRRIANRQILLTFFYRAALPVDAMTVRCSEGSQQHGRAR